MKRTGQRSGSARNSRVPRPLRTTLWSASEMESWGALELICRHIDYAMVRICSASGHGSTTIGRGSACTRRCGRLGVRARDAWRRAIGSSATRRLCCPASGPRTSHRVVGDGSTHRVRHRLVGELDLVKRYGHVLFTNPQEAANADDDDSALPSLLSRTSVIFPTSFFSGPYTATPANFDARH